MRRAADRADAKLALLAIFSLLEMALLWLDAAFGLLAGAVVLVLSPILPLCVFAVSPFIEIAARTPLPDNREEPGHVDSLVTPRDLAKHPQLELVNLLDKYLGGGVTATPYYEDIVGRIVVTARAAVRKQSFFRVACALSLAGQLLLALLFASRQV